MEHGCIWKSLWCSSWGYKNSTKIARRQRWLGHAVDANNIPLPSFNFCHQYNYTERQYFCLDFDSNRTDSVLACYSAYASNIRIKSSSLETDSRWDHLSSSHLYHNVLYRFRSRSWVEKTTRYSVLKHHVHQYWTTPYYFNKVDNILYCAQFQAMVCEETSLLVLVHLLPLL